MAHCPQTDLKCRLLYNAKFMVQALVMSDLLSNDRSLREVLSRAVRLVLPPALSEPLAAAIDSPSLRMPSASALSRWRFLLDASLMLHFRKSLHSEPCLRYAMADSSTQGGRDYELLVPTTISVSSLQDAFRLANALIAMRPHGATRQGSKKECFCFSSSFL